MIDQTTFEFWRNKATEKLMAEHRQITVENLCLTLASFLRQDHLTLEDAEIGLVSIEIAQGR
jgi:hypothetical protein